MIDYEDLGGVVVVTHTGQKTVSQLLVKRAEPSDSGKYTCQPSNGEAAFVMLHVLYGEWLWLAVFPKSSHCFQRP